MKKNTLFIAALLTAFGFGCFINAIATSHPAANVLQASISAHPNISLNMEHSGNMKLGAFSVSLSVKDLKASKAFYETLGFTVLGGDLAQNYLIMKNGNALIGLFHGMFEGHILTFNPGWDENAQNIENFDDVREIQKHLKNNSIVLTTEVAEGSSGPASIMLTDPDGNVILIDQHR